MQKVRKFIKKPTIIEAIKYEGNYESYMEVCNFVGEYLQLEIDFGSVTIPTAKGELKVSTGTWIIKGFQGEFYPCQDDIFKLTYELVVD